MKKQLLQESEVRKLMKFADIGALSDGFVSRITEAEMMDPEEEEPGGMTSGASPMSADPAAEEEPEMSLDSDVPAEEEDVSAEEEPGEDLASKVEELVTQLDNVLTAANPELAGMVSSQREEGAEDLGPVEEPVGPPTEEPVGPPGEEGPEAFAGTEDPEEEDVAVTEDLVNEVARRVARRLKKIRKK
tara:strand:+ start:4571 stop:5134 length:564 start_codon:yes stop_codon:yes gene_type:complete